MIIKVVRGSYFGGVVDYVTRRGKYAGRDDARVLKSQGLFSYRTFAAQLAYDAARDPRRTRPVVHLIARAERSLTDAQYQELGDRMLKVAGLEGRAHVEVVHDEPDDSEEGGHLHIVACEVDDEGKAPPRKFWDRNSRREVTAEEARTLPKGTAASRAWDSHLAWRLTGLARDVEAEWGLRQLSSKRSTKRPDEPEISRAQQEHLARTGMTPLQDRLYHEVRTALALSTWDERAAALAVHALVLRPYEAKGRVRGLMVQSINSRKDAVKVSAFDMGGMPKLDASADMPFLSWHPEYRAAINLRKTKVEARNDHWRATQRQFRLQLQDWEAIQKRRDAAYRRHKRDRAAIMDRFDKRLADEPRKAFHRQIRAERSDELAQVKASRDFALMEAGAKTPRPTFADFVAQRAAQGDAAAAEVHKDLLGKVSETRREALDQHKARIAKLAEAARALRADAVRLHEQLARLTAGLRDRIEPARTQAARIKAAALNRSRMTVMKLARKARRLAEQMVERLDRAGHRVHVADGHVSIDRFKPDRQTQALMNDPAHLPIFQNAADTQNSTIALLRDAVGGGEALAASNGRPEIDIAILKTDMHKHLRWQAEPEIQAILADLHKRREEKTAQARAERQSIQAKESRAMSEALGARQRERQALDVRAADIRARLVAAAKTRPGDSRATGIYLSAWQSALQTLPTGKVFDADRIRAIEVGAIGQLLNDQAGFDERVIKKLIERRSPAKAIVGTDAINAESIDALFEAALEQPGVRQKAEDNRTRAAELQDRNDALGRMEKAVREGSDSDSLWLDTYYEVLSRRPVDIAVSRDDRYGAIDRDVCATLLRRGLPWIEVRESLARLSPLSPTSSVKGKGTKVVDTQAHRRSFHHYVEATIAEAVEQDDESHMTVPDALPTAPPNLPSSIGALDSRQAGMLDFAPHPGPQDMTRFFGRDGQPDGALRDLLADVREKRTDYEIGPNGQLTAPGWTEDDQKNLLVIQQHLHVRALLLQAFAQDPGRGASVHRAGSSELEL
ncbi:MULTISPECIES: relaxase/mobilization nuclease domain-containing protein [Sphingobium]|uniref:relaxase/mobilization nuclease domain-containing protein n=1 Tax=Sphingobium TaxID=165695 RepID=UPI000DBAF278|nr:MULTISPECIES: hypothetical protein [Sphingobium]KAA9011363.1 hypothetical protein F4U94_20850 [Sphingobium limneticum]BBD02239.1 hypothetical protein YGS_C2P0252 [Sphingobium sp. YG1]